jgi:membrane dipeptidase
VSAIEGDYRTWFIIGGVSKNNFPSLSRRSFLTTAAGASGAMLLGPAWLHLAGEAVDPIDPGVAQVMAKTIGIDMHNHVYPAGTEPHPQHEGQPSRQQTEQPQGPELSIAEELRRSGLTAVCASFVMDFAPNNKPGDARENFLHWLTAIDAQLEKGHIRRALNLKDLEAAHDHGPPTIVQSVEGAHFLEGHLDRLEEVYKRGCDTCNCFTSETTWFRHWATQIRLPRTWVV